MGMGATGILPPTQRLSRKWVCLGVVVVLACLEFFEVPAFNLSITGTMELKVGGQQQEGPVSHTGGPSVSTKTPSLRSPKQPRVANTTHGEDESRNNNNNNNNQSTDSPPSDTTTINTIEEDPFAKHPGCRLLAAEKNNNHELPLATILQNYGKYVPASYGPRYDHTCFVLKPRYNCARPANDTASPKAHEYALALENNDNTTSEGICNLQEFVHDAGGPAGIGTHILENFRKRQPSSSDDNNNDNENNNDNDNGVVEVLLLATSRFRQLWESLVCAYEDQLDPSKFLVHAQTPEGRSNLTTLTAEHHLARPIGLAQIKNGTCHDAGVQDDFHKFYRPGVEPIPPNHDLCNDHVATATFRDAATKKATLRVSYVFRPWGWANTSEPFAELGMELGADSASEKPAADFLFWENRDDSPGIWDPSEDLGERYSEMFRLRNPPSFAGLREAYIELQQRDLGHQFGADNPWITDPPDIQHNCMPGVPDDKINLVLWYMLSVSALG